MQSPTHELSPISLNWGVIVAMGDTPISFVAKVLYFGFISKLTVSVAASVVRVTLGLFLDFKSSIGCFGLYDGLYGGIVLTFPAYLPPYSLSELKPIMVLMLELRLFISLKMT